MSRVIVPTESHHTAEPRVSRTSDGDARAPTANESALRQELADLQREVVSLRTQRQRDMATARGLGEALQALRRGAMALRTENEDLRRQLAARSSRKR